MKQRRVPRLAVVVAAVAFLCASSQGSAAEKRPVTFDDKIAMKSVGSATISPDGRWVLFIVRQWEPASPAASAAAAKEEPGKMEARTHLWRVSTADQSGDGGARQLTFGQRGESDPAWSPDGRWISFLSARGGGRDAEGSEGPRSQIWIMRAEGGEAWKLTDAKEGVVMYQWSPDSRQIAFTSRDPLSKDEEARRKRNDDPRVFEGDFRMTHLWRIDVERKEAARLTEGTELTIRGEPAWAPDGKRIAFAAAPTPLLRDGRADVYVVGTDGGALEKITSDAGPDQAPAWSPDGRTIAYIGQPNAQPPAPDGIPMPTIGIGRLMLYDVATKRVTDASKPGFDFSPGSVMWMPDSRRVLFTAGRRAYREVFAYDVAAKQYVQLTKGRLITFGSMTGDGSRVAFVAESSTAPPDVYVADAGLASPRKLTDMNPQVANLSLGESEVITWKVDGLEIEGVLLKPAGYQPGRRYPLLVDVHGGPAGAHHDSFRVTPGGGGQHWAGQGWAVLYPNPRGSSNYGERFVRANLNDWGGGDYRDIMGGVDALVARGIADSDRLAVMGWSYGGYMTSWIVSQTTRFTAAMVGAGLTSLFSMYGTNDIPGTLAAYFGGPPSASTLPLYVQRSGITTVQSVTTPVLILHGANDERVPVGQAMEFYRALKDQGKTVELVFYPREGHGLGEYYHQLDRLKRQYEWITKHTLGGSSRKTTSQ